MASRRTAGAVTLLEVMIAGFILAIGILAIIGVFTAGLQLMARSSEVSTAHDVAREVLERSRILGAAAIPGGDNTFDGSIPTPQTPAGFPPTPYPIAKRNGIDYTVTVRSREVAGSTVSVLVSVRWQEARGVQLETYFHP